MMLVATVVASVTLKVCFFGAVESEPHAASVQRHARATSERMVAVGRDKAADLLIRVDGGAERVFLDYAQNRASRRQPSQPNVSVTVKQTRVYAQLGA